MVSGGLFHSAKYIAKGAALRFIEESKLARVVQETPTSWNTPLLSRSVAGGLNTACVAQAYTSLAPCVCRTCRRCEAKLMLGPQQK